MRTINHAHQRQSVSLQVIKLPIQDQVKTKSGPKGFLTPHFPSFSSSFSSHNFGTSNFSKGFQANQSLLPQEFISLDTGVAFKALVPTNVFFSLSFHSPSTRMETHEAGEGVGARFKGDCQSRGIRDSWTNVLVPSELDADAKIPEKASFLSPLRLLSLICRT